MKQIAVVLAAFSVAALACSGGGSKSSPPQGVGAETPIEEPAAEVESPAPEVLSAAERGEDVLPEALEMNSSKFAPPPTTYRKGHVSPRRISKKALTRRTNGFEIKLPNGSPVATPAIYKGKLITGGGFRSKQLFAFAAETGEMIWGLNLDDDGPSAPACDDDVCVVNTESCTVFAVDANTGKMLWSWWLGDPLVSAPTIANGVVYVSYPPTGGKYPKGTGGKSRPPNASHVLGAFDLKSGQIMWQKWIDSDVMSAPVAVDGELFATSFNGTVYKLDGKTGKLLSARRDRATSAPVVVGKNVFYTQRAEAKGAAVALEGIASVGRDKGKKAWVRAKKTAKHIDKHVQAKTEYSVSSQADDAANGFGGGAPAAAKSDLALENVGTKSVSSMQSFQGSRILNSGGANYNCMGDEVIATDAKTGTKLWSYKLKGNVAKQGGFLGAPPIDAKVALLVGTLAGEVLEMDPKSGAVTRTYKVGRPIRSQPVVANGWIYIGTADGRLVAINTGKQKLHGWAMWGGNAQRTGVAN